MGKMAQLYADMIEEGHTDAEDYERHYLTHYWDGRNWFPRVTEKEEIEAKS
jgi:hypothetical protein